MSVSLALIKKLMSEAWEFFNFFLRSGQYIIHFFFNEVGDKSSIMVHDLSLARQVSISWSLDPLW